MVASSRLVIRPIEVIRHFGRCLSQCMSEPTGRRTVNISPLPVALLERRRRTQWASRLPSGCLEGLFLWAFRFYPLEAPDVPGLSSFRAGCAFSKRTASPALTAAVLAESPLANSVSEREVNDQADSNFQHSDSAEAETRTPPERIVQLKGGVLGTLCRVPW
jgi:hypothetical protein